jgi:hypothetical protein
MSGWEVRCKRDGELMHLVPTDDLRKHELSADCWCAPDEEVDWLLRHHSLDRREENELS